MGEYWREHAEIAADEAGLTDLSDAQLDAIAGVIESAHEFYGQSHGHDVASANFYAEKERAHEATIRELEARHETELETLKKSADRRAADLRWEAAALRDALQKARETTP